MPYKPRWRGSVVESARWALGSLWRARGALAMAGQYPKLTDRGKWLVDVLTLVVIMLGAAAILLWVIGPGK